MAFALGHSWGLCLRAGEEELGLRKVVDRGAEDSGHQRDFPQLGDLCAIPRDFRLNHFVRRTS